PDLYRHQQRLQPDGIPHTHVQRLPPRRALDLLRSSAACAAAAGAQGLITFHRESPAARVLPRAVSFWADASLLLIPPARNDWLRLTSNNRRDFKSCEVLGS